jgi:hypothetical protein
MIMADVYADWAESMQQLSLGAINFGIEAAKSGAHPPSQGEFVQHCKQFKPDTNVLRIESKITTEQQETNRARIAEIARKFAAKAVA